VHQCARNPRNKHATVGAHFVASVHTGAPTDDRVGVLCVCVLVSHVLRCRVERGERQVDVVRSKGSIATMWNQRNELIL
jgi:hypothetical protein